MRTYRERQFPHGAIKHSIEEWVETAPDGKPFYYGDIADDLALQRPTVSAALLAMARSDSPPIVFGKKSGWYVKPLSPAVRTPEQPEPETELNGTVYMEVVGTMRSGNFMLRAADGSLYEAKPI
jgi:hypothetical protein